MDASVFLWGTRKSCKKFAQAKYPQGPLDEEQTDRREITKTTPYEPIEVTARCTKVALEERILKITKTDTRRCGKTTWVVKHFELGRDVVITTTQDAARDLKEKLASRLGADASGKVRTMASVLVNDFRGPKNRDRPILDKAHELLTRRRRGFASLKDVFLIDDANQLPFIDMLNLLVKCSTFD
ncbi:hypothetical protein EVAR_100450_1 [Eumeta japonica]|uniref:(+)RNA virus helicase C-terminal domain-containing protein n=1 Tax=Eumeta variegata TaxID=151549 RepID=A0A4C1ZY24_EUMVA|nr:hypothetical protein EVAR_100450_1 [Eumeta japonica]